MGENANKEDMEMLMEALQGSLKELGFDLASNLRESFKRFVKI